MSAVETDALVVRLPHAMRLDVEAFAKRQGLSLEEFVFRSVGLSLEQGLAFEKISSQARMRDSGLAERYRNTIPDVEPEEIDRII